MQRSHVEIRRSPVAYSSLADTLAQKLPLIGFAQVYHELCDGPMTFTQTGIHEAVAQVVKVLDDQEYFPVFREYAEEFIEFGELSEVAPGDLYLPPITEFLVVDGINPWNSCFDDLNDLDRLVWAICFREASWEKSQTLSWWATLNEKLGLVELPPLDEIDIDIALERAYQDGIPGLKATFEWIGGNTGNVFVDVAPEDSGELRWDFDWSMETIHSLTAEYDEAKATIFDPANALLDRYKNNPVAVLRQVAIYLLTGELIDEHS